MYTQLAGDVTWWESLLFSYTKLSYLGEHSEVSQARSLHACWTRMLYHDRLETIENSQSTNTAKTLKYIKSCLVYIQVYNLFVCTLCPCLTSFPQWNWYANNNEISARSTCHVSRERAVLGLIALRKHDTQQSHLCKKVPSLTYML